MLKGKGFCYCAYLNSFSVPFLCCEEIGLCSSVSLLNMMFFKKSCFTFSVENQLWSAEVVLMSAEASLYWRSRRGPPRCGETSSCPPPPRGPHAHLPLGGLCFWSLLSSSQWLSARLRSVGQVYTPTTNFLSGAKKKKVWVQHKHLLVF